MCKKILLAALALSLSGCANSSISYVDDTSNIADTSMNDIGETTTNSQSGGKIDGSVWEDKVVTTDNTNREYTIRIDATIQAEQADLPMSIYEFGVVTSLSPEQKENILKAVFTESEIYQYDKEDWPKVKWQDKVDLYSRQLDASENYSYRAIVKKKLDEAEECLKSASDSLTVANDFSGTEFLGYINGMPHTFSFRFVDEVKRTFEERIANGEIEYGDPNEEPIQKIDWGMYIYPEKSISNYTADMSVLKFKDKTDFMNFTKGLLAGMGMDNYTYNPQDAHFDENNNEYSLNVTQGVSCAINGYPLLIRYDYIDENNNPSTIVGGIPQNYGYVSVYKDRVCATFSTPLELINETEDVPLLSLGDIKSIIKGELENHGVDYIRVPGDRTAHLSYSKMECCYISVVEKNGKRISKIPCWRLEDEAGGLKEVFINAVDGSLIPPLVDIYSKDVYSSLINNLEQLPVIICGE